MPDSPSKVILERLRRRPESLDQLVVLGLDHLLDSRVETLIEPAWLAHAITDGLRASASSPDFETWVHNRVEQALSRADELEGPIAEKMPITVLAPIERALAREVVPDRELVRAVLDHASVRELIREILHANLLEFGRRLRAAVPDAASKRAASLPGMGIASRLAGVAKGVASAVSGEVERQLDGKVQKFVDEILGHSVDMAIERLSAEEHADEMARWRVDMLHAVVQQPLERLLAERKKYPPDQMAADLSALLQALAAWKELGALIEDGLERVLQESGKSSVRSWLEGSGLEDAWRPQLEEAFGRQARALVETESFAAWLSSIAD